MLIACRFCLSFAFVTALITVQATPIPIGSPSAFTFAGICLSSTDASQNCDIDALQLYGSTVLDVHQSFDPQGGGSIRISSTSSAQPGTFKTYVDTTLNSPGSWIDGIASGEAGFTDVLTTSFQPFTGQIGYLELQFTVNGQIASLTPNGMSICPQCDLYVEATVNDGVSLQGQAAEFIPSGPNHFVSANYIFPQFFHFTYGQPYSLDFLIWARIRTPSGTGTTTFANIGNTVTISGLRIFDSNLNPVSAATFSAESGAQYTQTGVVPEPGTATLFALALISCVPAIVRRLRSSHT